MKVKTILEFVYCHDDCPALFTITPLADTRQKLKDHQLGYRTTNNGFFVYATLSNETDNEYLIPPGQDGQLSFAMYSNDLHWPNDTGVTIKPGEAVFYGFADEQAHQLQFDQTQYYPLQQKGLLVNKQQFKVAKINADDDEPEQFKISQPGDQGNAAFPSARCFYLDTSQWPDGLYKVSEGDGAKNCGFNGEKVFVDRALIANPPLAIVRCALPDVPQSTQPISLSFNKKIALEN